MQGRGIEIVYDGECPFCAAYTRILRLRERAGPVTLIDARSDDARVHALRAAGYDLEAGMVARYEGRVYHGAQAMTLLAALSAPEGMLNRLQSRVLRAPKLTAALYPIFVVIRRATLRVLRRGRLDRK